MSTIEVLRQAALQFQAASRWWRENRPKAPGVFEREIESALRAIAETPRLGTAYPARLGREVRRWLLPTTRYHLFYEYSPERKTVFVLALWAAMRGHGPRLPRIP